MSATWTEEALELIASRWKEKRSLQQIADEVSKVLGETVTRNAISGKINRMGLFAKRPKPKPPIKEAYNKVLTFAPKPQVRDLPLEIPGEPESRRLTLHELTRHTCKWPTHGNFLYCGHPPLENRSFCEFHMSIARRKTHGPPHDLRRR